MLKVVQRLVGCIAYSLDTSEIAELQLELLYKALLTKVLPKFMRLYYSASIVLSVCFVCSLVENSSHSKLLRPWDGGW